MAPPKRIGVLTFHRCINYGSYWQARCLVEGLRAQGHDAVLLDHQSRRINLAEWRCALRPIPEADPRSYRQAYVSKARKFFAAFEDLPRSRPFPLHAPEQSEAYDLVLVGSDEVWNLRHPWYGGEGLFYGEGLPATRLASYAASFGNQPSSHALDEHWSQRLGRFHDISVRDRNSQELVMGATGHRPTLVLDPCLQFDQFIPRTTLPPSGTRYAVVYGHGFPEWLSVAVAAWAAANDIKLVSIGYDNAWADEQQIDAGPLQFADLMSRASAVITNFFHGCVFALVNGKPFVTAPTDYRFNKVRDLVGALSAEHHMVSPLTSSEELARLLVAPLDPQIGQQIGALRAESTAYLDRVLA
ncbi:MAG: polysaccharide pyruvyl transferase [Devosia sp.]|nr:polysaccharide pyruvyl transferase [Devosia sp.]